MCSTACAIGGGLPQPVTRDVNTRWAVHQPPHGNRRFIFLTKMHFRVDYGMVPAEVLLLGFIACQTAAFCTPGQPGVRSWCCCFFQPRG